MSKNECQIFILKYLVICCVRLKNAHRLRVVCNNVLGSSGANSFVLWEIFSQGQPQLRQSLTCSLISTTKRPSSFPSNNSSNTMPLEVKNDRVAGRRTNKRLGKIGWITVPMGESCGSFNTRYERVTLLCDIG